ncbi:helix-turn-helix transcriptional regulator [Dyella sp. C9]|uniref:helix-turn-helix domain-containing protein n=1 Tax=Dyella sp. C9 TaxID=2202154 RepID=UPI001300B9BD|nr:helix-turn-helix transcriptional regulator [Dyella sp. C9]
MKPTSVYRPEHVILITLLKEYRLKAGLTQAAVSEHLGISQTGVSDMEIGSRGVDHLVLRDLCKLYGVSMAQLEAELEKRTLDGRIEPAPRIERKDKKRL